MASRRTKSLTKNETMKQAIKHNALFVWGFLSMLLLAGESETMSTGTFLLIKLVAIVSLILCVRVGKRMDRPKKA